MDERTKPAGEHENGSGLNVTARTNLVKDPQSKTLAMATVTIADSVVISGVRVVDGKDGKPPFVSMPQRKSNDGRFADVCYLRTCIHRPKHRICEAKFCQAR